MDDPYVTITVRRKTRDRLVQAKGMGYTYDRFFADLMNLYEKEKTTESRSLPGSSRPVIPEMRQYNV